MRLVAERPHKQGWKPILPTHIGPGPQNPGWGLPACHPRRRCGPASPQGLQFHTHWADTAKPAAAMAGPPRSQTEDIRPGQRGPCRPPDPLFPAGVSPQPALPSCGLARARREQSSGWSPSLLCPPLEPDTGAGVANRCGPQ